MDLFLVLVNINGSSLLIGEVGDLVEEEVAVVEGEEHVDEEEGDPDPHQRLKTWMPSWMPTETR